MRLDEIEYNSLENLLHYMYHGEVIVNDMIELVFKTGHRLEVRSLQRADDLMTVRPNEKNPSAIHIYARSTINYDHRKYDKHIENSEHEKKKALRSANLPQFSFSSESESWSEHESSHDESEDTENESSALRVATSKKVATNGRKQSKRVRLLKLKKARQHAKQKRTAPTTQVKKPNKQERTCVEETLFHENEAEQNGKENGVYDENDNITNGRNFEKVEARASEQMSCDDDQNDKCDEVYDTEELGAY